jgi:hypothetical protein
MKFQPAGRSWQLVLTSAVVGTIIVYAFSVVLVELLRLTVLSPLLTGQPPFPNLSQHIRKISFRALDLVTK